MAYQVTFDDYNDIVAFRNALKIHKAILEASAGSAYELAHNREYINICKALESVEKHL